MPEVQDFYFIERSKDQAFDVFINLANVTRIHWDGETMIVMFRDGENTYVTGDAARKLRTVVSNRCANQVPMEE